MLDFVLALARIVVDTPYIAVSNDDNEESPCLEMRHVQQLYDELNDFDKHRLADVWQMFLAIVDRQNDVQRDAVQLSVMLVRCIGRELAERSGSNLGGNSNPDDDGEWEGVEELQAELWRLACQMPRVLLAELVEFARGQVEVV